MEEKPMNEVIRSFVDSRMNKVDARLFLSREDGITVYDSVQNHTTSSISALVSGVWQASQAMVSLVNEKGDGLEFRLGFDTSSQGIYLLPLRFQGKQYLFGAIYQDCLNPGQLKRQISLLKDELHLLLNNKIFKEPKSEGVRKEYLFQDITDSEMDKLFSLGGI